MDKGDKASHDPKDLPRVVACLIHPAMTAVMHHEAKEINGYETVQYGLCGWCESKLKHDPTYARHIDKKICERLENLTPEGGT